MDGSINKQNTVAIGQQTAQKNFIENLFIVLKWPCGVGFLRWR